MTTQPSTTLSSFSAGDTLNGTVTRKGPGLFDVLLNGQTLVCSLAPRFIKSDPLTADLAVGDQVLVHIIGPGQAHITGRLPRRNVIQRRAPSHHTHVSAQAIASNLDQVAFVFACAEPAPKWNLLDRYLVSAEAAGIPGLILLTKADLLDDAPGLADDIEQATLTYTRIGYMVIRISSLTGEGVEATRSALRGKLTALLGKSGVGKTSLLNALQPHLGQRVGEVSRTTSKGKHTTTAMQMFTLDSEGGAVIDTPGIREFGLWDASGPDLALHFPEMRPHVGRCRFGLDCRHDQEPGCAIRQAVMRGEISPYRYQSYLKLSEE